MPLALLSSLQMRIASLAVAVWVAAGGESAEEGACPGQFLLQGLGNVSLVPTGWGPEVAPYPDLQEGGVIKAWMGSRSYFATACTAGRYDNEQYLALDLRGKTLTYTTDLSRAGCGCNAALYLTSMRQNTRASACGDYYCDANNVCGESCAEIDIQESNMFSWHSTLHSATDHTGLGKGYGGGGPGWSGPRDWGSAEYGPHAKCIDTTLPFQVSAYFPVNHAGQSTGMEITVTQHGKDCPLWIRVDGYSDMAALDEALAAGMTPIVSYWRSDDMLWMDGKGSDNMGPCFEDRPSKCAESVSFYDFAVRPSFPATTGTTTTGATTSAPARTSPPEAGVDPVVVQAFFSGALSLVGAQLVCVIAAWAVHAVWTRREPSVCPTVPADNPLNGMVRSSSQSLLMLAESAEAGMVCSRPSRDAREVAQRGGAPGRDQARADSGADP
eukprot:CAMPEP_0175200810 /NCGR_PEP_ID=MMETSP0093-20121207/9725_1 /TAXON_ID=311494 /ORGANISM="Alexandrium monilatum, Strain CCMP3105" /LENGTH=440 /DNA_ID=CAMNT_0016493827 /DNA_START=14 /DNA_END=1336 /DNA_ORIENTATION=-